MAVSCTSFKIGALLSLILILKISVTKSGKDLLTSFQQSDYQVKFERMNLLNGNKKFLSEGEIVTFKYNRSSAVANVTFIPKKTLADDMTIIVQAYKFMSNEYRLFPLRFAMNVCKGIKANIVGINDQKCGNFSECPLYKGRRYHLCNWVPNASKFPPFVPNGQFKVDMQILSNTEEVASVDAYITIFREEV